ncbi:MAG TPA: response regulator transcription factor [Alphaproteobacteria bacterium]|nr:response regulator transcription factor [Alphaproteobacteria bacterium]
MSTWRRRFNSSNIMRVLLIEDNEKLAKFTVKGLEAAGFTADWLANGTDAENALSDVSYDAAILDLGLPDMDGMTLIAKVRRRANNVPILVLTARDGTGDRVTGLNAGADDYLLKPFAMEELVARIHAILRRPSDALDITLVTGNMILDSTRREFRIDQHVVPLSRREFMVMEHLMRRVGKVVPKTAIEEKTYGFDEEVSPNAVEVIVSRLRKRLRDSNASQEILTFRGVGYMLKGLE